MGDARPRHRPETSGGAGARGRRALVLGAGISGLAAAHRLRGQGLAVTVLEAASRPGGALRTIERDGFRFELGPNTVHHSPELEALCLRAGCAERLRPAATEARRRYLARGDALVALPGRPAEILTTPLLSWPARLRLLGEPLRGRGPGPEESVAAFVRRRLGRGAADLADAMVTGIYAGDPEELAVGYALPRLYALEREHGSLLRGLRARAGGAPAPYLIGSDGGFGALAEALAAPLDLRRGTAAAAIAAVAGGFRVERAGPGGEPFEAERLVLALPAAETARLLAPLAPHVSLEPLAALPHAPVAVLGLGYDRGDVGHPLDGFGFLVPHRENRRILGCLFVSTLFPDAAPPGAVALTAMIGGRRRPELASLDDEALVALAGRELEPLLGLAGAPRAAVVARWRPGIPQPTPALAGVRRAVRAATAGHRGLEVLGAWLDGVGVPDCVRAGWLGPDSSGRGAAVDSPQRAP